MPQPGLSSGFVGTVTPPMRLSASTACDCLSESCSKLSFLAIDHLAAALQVTCRCTSPASLMYLVGRGLCRRPPSVWQHRPFVLLPSANELFLFQSPDLWNELPSDITSAPSSSVYRKHLSKDVPVPSVISVTTRSTSDIYFSYLTLFTFTAVIGADFRKSQWVHAPIPLSSLPSLLSFPIPSFPSFPSPPLSFPLLFSPFPSIPLEVGPVNTARGLGSAASSPGGVWTGAPAEIEFGAF